MFPFASLCGMLEDRIRQRVSGANMAGDVERPRLQLLRDACKLQDVFFLALHQALCIWSLSRAEAHALFRVSHHDVDAAFDILEQILKKNDNVPRDSLIWFSRFPNPMGGLLSSSQDYCRAVAAVGLFFELLVPNWTPLVAVTLKRQYPYLVDEMLTNLGCASSVLQTIFFTSSRRRLGVMDGQISHAMESLFFEDQRAHMTPDGFFVRGPPATMGAVGLEQRNLALVTAYRHYVQEASLARTGAPKHTRTPSGATRPPLLPNQHILGAQGISTPSSITMRRQWPPPPVTPTHVVLTSDHTHASPPLAPHPAIQSGQGPPQAAAQTQPWVSFQLEQAREAARQRRQHPLQTQHAGAHDLFPAPPHFHQTAPALPTQQQLHQTSPPQPDLAWAVPLPNSLPGPRASPRMNGAPPRVNGAAMATSGPPLGGPSLIHLNGSSHSPAQGMTFQIIPSQGMGQRQQGPRLPNLSVAPQPYPRHQAVHTRRYVPPNDQPLSRSEWPYDTTDRKSIAMSLHQAHLRSPRRVMQEAPAPSGGPQTERHYQAIKKLALGPVAVPVRPTSYRFVFVVGEEEMRLLSTKQTPPVGLLPFSEYFNGSLRYRVRCCVHVDASKTGVITETQWVTKSTSWPSNIFITLNKKTQTVRRETHNGKDLPVELTDVLRVGENVLEVVVPPNSKTAPRPTHYLAVEVIETLSHSAVMDQVRCRGAVGAGVTLDRIKSRLAGSTGGGGDEGVSVQQKELSIDLADPFSATLFRIPSRSETCLHMECFDLETWLNTRPLRTTPACHHKTACRCKSPEPSMADKWKCPICLGDARPYSLRIDGFLQGVREKLEAQGKLGAKSLLVAADGTWRTVIETDDGEGSDGEDTARHKKPKAARPAPAQEVIDLLDDD